MGAIALIDYDAGNLRSVQKAFAFLGENAVVTRDPKEILRADKAVLPGVGAFGDAMEKLNRYGLTDVIHECIREGKPFLGICLGLQLLFERSEESDGVPGLAALEGEIVRIPSGNGLKIPHVGWNSLENLGNHKLFKGIPEGSYVYFVHSYYLKAKNLSEVAATTEYGVSIHAAVEKGNVFACQFHPEKSGDVGMAILENFAKNC